MPDLLFGPTPHDQAIAYIQGKPALARDAYDRLLPELKPLAFTVAGVDAADAVQRIRDTVAELPAGLPWKEVRAKVIEQLTPWIVDRTAEAEVQAGQAAAAARKAELLLRLHGGQAYAAASEQVLQRQKAAFPYWQYLTLEDARVRPSHAALDKVILPANDPFWAGHTPPWDWGCRCLKVAISREDYAETQAADARRAPDARLALDEADRRRLNGEHRLARDGRDFDLRTPNPYRFDPSSPEGLRPDLARLQARYDAATWAEFERFARQETAVTAAGSTLWDWMGGEPRRETGWLGRETIADRGAFAGTMISYSGDLDAWNEHLGLSPARLQTLLLRGMPGDIDRIVVTHQAGTGVFGLEMYAPLRPGDATDLRIAREWDFDSGVAKHIDLLLPESLQAAGLGRAHLATLLELYDHWGLGRITLDANVDVGGYAWARYGFRTDQRGWDGLRQGGFLNRDYPERVRRLRATLPPGVAATMDAILADPRPAMLQRLTELRYPVGTLPNGQPKTLGMALLENTSWPGSLDLEDPLQYRELRDYLAGRR